MRKYEGYYAANAEGNWEKMPLMDVSLVIADVNEDDVGEYYMKMDMDGVTMEKTMMLPGYCFFFVGRVREGGRWV